MISQQGITDDDADDDYDHDDGDDSEDGDDGDSGSQGTLETRDRCPHILMTHSSSTGPSSS